MVQLAVLMAGLLLIADSHASEAQADPSSVQGFLSQYVPAATQRTSATKSYMVVDDKPVTKDFDLPKTAATGNNTPMSLSAIGVGLLALATMLGVRIVRGSRPATILASGGADNIMEMKSDPVPGRFEWDPLELQPAVFAVDPKTPSLPIVRKAIATTALAGAMVASAVPSPALAVVKIGLPGGSEVLVPGAPFQPDNGYLGMWNWEKTGAKAIPKDQTPEQQKIMMEQFEAERKKADVEAQQQGFENAIERGKKQKIEDDARKAREEAERKAAKEAEKAKKAAEAAAAEKAKK